MADDGANGSEVYRIVSFAHEERRLQNAGREVDIVHLRVIIRVDCGRGHLPLQAIHRLADLIEIAMHLKSACTPRVSYGVVAGNGYGGIILPLLGVADLIG